MNKQPGIPGFPMIPVFIWGIVSRDKIIEFYNGICDTLDYEGFYDEDLISELIHFFKMMNDNLLMGEFEFQSLLKRETPDYPAYLADVTLIRKDWNPKFSKYQKTEYWPSVMLYHKFDPGFKGQIRIRRKSTFFSFVSESSFGLVKAPLDNPMPGFEKKIFVSCTKPAPLQELINADVQDFLLKEYGEYPLKIMDNPFDGININRAGIIYLNRRTLKDVEIRKFIMFGEKFTTLIRGLLEVGQ